MNGWGDAVQYHPLTTAAGEQFSVPEYILRVEGAAAGGWQLRYGEWTTTPMPPAMRRVRPRRWRWRSRK